MDEIEELQQELEELEAEAERKQKIKDLKKKIKGKRFAQSTGGKVFNKIADIGEGLGNKIMDADRNADAQKKGKVKSLQETMDDLPQ